jgi:hypothetical protein
MSEKIKNIELKTFYEDGTIETKEFDNFVCIGISVDQKENRIDVKVINRLDEIYHAHVAIKQMKKVIEGIEKSIETCPIEKMAFDITSQIFSIFEEEGLEGIKKAYKNNELNITEDDYNHALKVFKNAPRPEVKKNGKK